MLLARKVVDEREALIAQIEETGAEMKRAGLAEAWLACADEGAAQVASRQCHQFARLCLHSCQVSATVNGPLLEMLAKACLLASARRSNRLAHLFQAIDYKDAACVDMLRYGAPIIGQLPQFHGGGQKVAAPEKVDLEAFDAKAPAINMRVLAKLREDEHAANLHRACLQDAQKGRMTPPVLATAEHCMEFVLSPRFSVEQGVRLHAIEACRCAVACFVTGLLEDGSPKIRPIDDLTSSGVNKHTHAVEKLTNDTLDLLLEAMRRIKGKTEVGSAGIRFSSPFAGPLPLQDEMALFKADIDSAYRRVPICPGVACMCREVAAVKRICAPPPLLSGHRRYATVAYKLHGKTYVSQHVALPFGAAAAVQGWHRIGLLACIRLSS